MQMTLVQSVDFTTCFLGDAGVSKELQLAVLCHVLKMSLLSF